MVEPLRQWSLAAGTGHASSAEIDQLGMRAALALAASRAIESLGVIPDVVICDGPLDLLDSPNLEVARLVQDHRWLQSPPPHIEAVVKGDERCQSVAGASVLAKVERDRLMADLDHERHFDFVNNAGYPAPRHLAGLEEYGLQSFHRMSWSFVERYKSSMTD
jgi:ribonuclease HII